MSTDKSTETKADLTEAALRYHRVPKPGKLEITATKPLATQRDLALAYSPGVAAACEAIVEDPAEAATVTSRGNLVAVVSNGTAVLGLGPIGALASKPVMEGKAVLFKKFAGIDVFDIEVDERDPTSWSMWLRPSRPPSGRSISKTSRRRTVLLLNKSYARPYVLLGLSFDGAVRPTLAAFNEGCLTSSASSQEGEPWSSVATFS